MTMIPRFFCGDKTKLERFNENDYIYAFRVQVPVFVIAPSSEAYGSSDIEKDRRANGTIGIENDLSHARCFFRRCIGKSFMNQKWRFRVVSDPKKSFGEMMKMKSSDLAIQRA